MILFSFSAIKVIFQTYKYTFIRKPLNVISASFLLFVGHLRAEGAWESMNTEMGVDSWLAIRFNSLSNPRSSCNT